MNNILIVSTRYIPKDIENTFSNLFYYKKVKMVTTLENTVIFTRKYYFKTESDMLLFKLKYSEYLVD